jgi:hypothetical protein
MLQILNFGKSILGFKESFKKKVLQIQKSVTSRSTSKIYRRYSPDVDPKCDLVRFYLSKD